MYIHRKEICNHNKMIFYMEVKSFNNNQIILYIEGMRIYLIKTKFNNNNNKINISSNYKIILMIYKTNNM